MSLCTKRNHYNQKRYSIIPAVAKAVDKVDLSHPSVDFAGGVRCEGMARPLDRIDVEAMRGGPLNRVAPRSEPEFTPASDLWSPCFVSKVEH